MHVINLGVIANRSACKLVNKRVEVMKLFAISNRWAVDMITKSNG